MAEPDNPESLALLRLRAQARAVLEDPDRLPVIVVEYVGVEHDSEGEVIGPATCDVDRATVKIPGGADRHYTRRPDETIEAFTARMTAALPVMYAGRELWWDRGGPGVGVFCITLWPREEAETGSPAR